MAKHNIKLAYNAKLDFRGMKINADGWDFNMSIGYVYLITPAEGTKLNFEVPKKPSAEDLKILDKMEKVQHTYLLWVTEGDEASITAEVEAFMEKLYKTGALAKAREPKKPEKTEKKEGDGDAKADGDAKKDDEPKKKAEKSKVMQMIEDDADKDDKKDDKKDGKKDKNDD
jgi:hypothetical protein